jgi:menaquinone-dependent protoporphyrinogen oxidase
VAYGTRHGKSAQLARRIADRMHEAGHDVSTVDLRADRNASLTGYEAVVVGASVHGASFEREVRQWVTHHRDEIAARPNAFFTVSLTSVDHDPEHRERMREMLSKFYKATGWRPQDVATFAGALVYSKYNPLLRWVMKGIVRREGHPEFTDMSHDYDFTDYAQVDAFARRFTHRLRTATKSSA